MIYCMLCGEPEPWLDWADLVPDPDDLDPPRFFSERKFGVYTCTTCELSRAREARGLKVWIDGGPRYVHEVDEVRATVWWFREQSKESNPGG